jgi:hypothetical protein
MEERGESPDQSLRCLIMQTVTARVQGRAEVVSQRRCESAQSRNGDGREPRSLKAMNLRLRPARISRQCSLAQPGRYASGSQL